MDIWSWIIISLIALIAILIVIETILRQNKERDRIGVLFAVLYQTREYMQFALAFHNHSNKLKKELPQISDREFVQIFISLLRKSSALASVTYSRAEKTFDYLKNTSFAESSMLDEDKELLEEILKTENEDDQKLYNLDLNDESLKNIRNILKKETNKLVMGNI